MTYGGVAFGELPYGGTPFDSPAPPAAAGFENILFLSSLEFDRATVTATSSTSGLPVTNLQDIDPDRKWRSVGKIGQRITINLARAVACTDLGITGHNFTGAGMARIRGALTVEGLTDPIVDNGWRSVWPSTGKPNVDDWPSWSSLIRWSNENELPVWEIEFADIGVSTDDIEVGRLWIGRAFQPAANVDLNVGLGLDSPDTQVRTAFGKTFADPRGPSSRRLKLSFTSTNKNDLMEGFFELRRYSGLAKDFFVALNPAETTNFHRYTLQALFADSAEFEAQPYFDQDGQVWQQSLTITEIV